MRKTGNAIYFLAFPALQGKGLYVKIVKVISSEKDMGRNEVRRTDGDGHSDSGCNENLRREG